MSGNGRSALARVIATRIVGRFFLGKVKNRTAAHVRTDDQTYGRKITKRGCYTSQYALNTDMVAWVLRRA